MNRALHNILLVAIAASLSIIALRPVLYPAPARADEGDFNVYVEPGTSALRAPDGSQQVMGKVVIDLRNGNIWGFPTLGAQPYPIDNTRTTAPISRPMFLGRFDLDAMKR